MSEKIHSAFTTISGVPPDVASSGDLALNPTGFVLVIMAAVLGGIALVLTLVYAYIYCTKIKPRPRAVQRDRINYYERDACVCGQLSGQQDKEQPEKVPIKAHPFFVISYVSRLKSNGGDASPFPSTSSKTH